MIQAAHSVHCPSVSTARPADLAKGESNKHGWWWEGGGGGGADFSPPDQHWAHGHFWQPTTCATSHGDRIAEEGPPLPTHSRPRCQARSPGPKAHCRCEGGAPGGEAGSRGCCDAPRRYLRARGAARANPRRRQAVSAPVPAASRGVHISSGLAWRFLPSFFMSPSERSLLNTCSRF
jgi:hypothetical protein